MQEQESNLRPLGHEPNELPTAPSGEVLLLFVGCNGIEPLFTGWKPAVLTIRRTPQILVSIGLEPISFVLNRTWAPI